MIEFRQIEITDKIWIDELLKYSDYRGAEYCFTNLFIWDGIYKSKIARHKDFVLLRGGAPDNFRYLYPAGRGDKREVVDFLIKNAAEQGERFMFIGIAQDTKEELMDLFPNRFEFKAIRDSFDYIYESEKLISLAGKKLQSKRNHINRFRELPDWQYEDLTPDKIPEVVNFNSKWCKSVDCDKNESLGWEACAVAKCLAFYPDLNLKGGLLRVDGDVVAYTIGEAVNSDTVMIHIEKAFAEVRGAYPMINREFAERVAAGYKYISREDDAGDAGLRQAKESYYPVFMQEKYSAILF